MISREAIEAYHGRTEFIRPLGFGFANSLYSAGENDNFHEVLNGYMRGNVSPEELLSGIDKKIQMMILEGN